MTGLRLFNHCSVTPPKTGLYKTGHGVLEEKVFCSKLHCLEAKVKWITSSFTSSLKNRETPASLDSSKP